MFNWDVCVSRAGDITTEREPAAPDSPAYTVPYQVGVVAMDIIFSFMTIE